MVYDSSGSFGTGWGGGCLFGEGYGNGRGNSYYVHKIVMEENYSGNGNGCGDYMTSGYEDSLYTNNGVYYDYTVGPMDEIIIELELFKTHS